MVSRRAVSWREIAVIGVAGDIFPVGTLGVRDFQLLRLVSARGTSAHLFWLGEIHSGREDTVSLNGTYHRRSSVAASAMCTSGFASGLNTSAIGAMSRQNSR